MNNQEKNTYVRNQILRALLNMMQEQPFADISISALVSTAQVGRASFYRNFTDKEDVLRQENDRLTAQWKQSYDTAEHAAPNELLISLLDFYSVVFLDVLNNAERISDHCSNIAVRMVGMEAGDDYDSHTLKNIMHHSPSKDYMLEYEQCRKEYLVPLEEMEA